MSFILIGLAMGFVFGWALEKSRVFEPGIIVGQMQLRNFIMLKVFLSAVVTGLIILSVLTGLGYAELHPKALYYTGTIVGGLLLGIGITLSGACPGTALAQAGAGYRDAWFTILGGIAGAMAFGYFQPELSTALLSDSQGKITFVDLTGIPFWQIAIPVAVLLVGLMTLIEAVSPWRGELGESADGYFPQAQSDAERLSQDQTMAREKSA